MKEDFIENQINDTVNERLDNIAKVESTKKDFAEFMLNFGGIQIENVIEEEEKNKTKNWFQRFFDKISYVLS